MYVVDDIKLPLIGFLKAVTVFATLHFALSIIFKNTNSNFE
jgi:hypothetical protein